MRLASVILTLLACLALPTGCGSSTSGGGSASCSPACPTGTHCVASGCIADGPPPDLAVTTAADLGGDGGGACEPACAAPTPYCQGGTCWACLSDDHCPLGSTCRKAAAFAYCAPGCTSDGRCPQDGGVADDGGAGGALSCCAMACVDTGRDPAHCGACGKACAPNHAQPLCSAGRCGAGPCDPGYGDCNHDPSDGCEVHLAVDVANCGACGRACVVPSGVAGCSGACYVAGCTFGHDDCNGVVADGCEADVLSDVRSCGGCGRSCGLVAHGKPVCLGGQCRSSCDPGYGDCNGDPADGCEAAFASDAMNCGACGQACAPGLVCVHGGCTCPKCVFANAKSLCLNLVCHLGPCLPGFADCDGVEKNGCEANLNLDSKNCGACNNACPMNTPSCLKGQCALFQGLVQLVDPGLDKRVVLQNGGGMLSMNLDAMDGSSNVLMTHSAAVQVGGNNAAGLPDDGVFAANNDHPEIHLAANNLGDGSFNARILVKTGTFNLPVPQRTYTQLQLYAGSTEGSSNVTTTLNYADSTTDSLTITINDWYIHPVGQGQFYFIDMLDRYSIANNKYDGAHTPGLVGWNLNPDPNKQVVSIDVTLNRGGWLVFFGGTGQ